MFEKLLAQKSELRAKYQIDNISGVSHDYINEFFALTGYFKINTGEPVTTADRVVSVFKKRCATRNGRFVLTYSERYKNRPEYLMFDDNNNHVLLDKLADSENTEIEKILNDVNLDDKAKVSLLYAIIDKSAKEMIRIIDGK